ncbi:MAG: hypothetical protein ACYC9I_02540, partial [Desulfuromonadales bacterium]
MEKQFFGDGARNKQDGSDQDVFLSGGLPADSGKQASRYGPPVTYQRIHFSTQERFQLPFPMENRDGETDSIHDFRIFHRLSDST